MSDRILVHRVAIFAHHGALPEETRLGQRFFVSLDVALDLAAAGRSDDLADTVSYADLVAIATRVATTRRFRLIEALAETIAAEVLAAFPALLAVSVRVDKPDAPIPGILDGVSVEIARRRGG